MFFSVNVPIKIGGKVFRPCICYEMTPYFELTVKKLAEEGKVTLYTKRVHFCNGKIVEDKPVAKEAPATEKKSKRAKREVIEEEEEIPSPQEIADDMTAGEF